METRRRRPTWTEDEREHVLELAAKGTSQREIAQRVFGDSSYRGRVERLLKADAAASLASQVPRISEADEADDDGTPPLSDLELFRKLVGRAERALLRNTSAPSLADIQRLLRIKREVNTLEAIERMNAAADRANGRS